MKLLSSSRFSTEAYEESQRFEAWRQYLPLYDVLPHPEAAAASFAGSVASYQAGPIGIGITAFSPQRYVRTRQRIAADGQDHIIVQLLTGGALDAEALCGAFRMSRANLYRLFSAEGGVAAVVRHRRLERAEALLRHTANTGRTIAEIAFDCGFVSEAHFSRAFRAAFAVSPREVRGTGLGPLDETVLSRWESVARRD